MGIFTQIMIVFLEVGIFKNNMGYKVKEDNIKKLKLYLKKIENVSSTSNVKK